MHHNEKVRKVEGHTCSLPQDDELIELYINGGVLVDFRRSLRKYMMINAANPETKSVLKSSAQIRSEEGRHLRNYYFMIHPFSEARMTWETVMIVVYFSLYILMPIEFGLPIVRNLILWGKFICDMLSITDIVLFFCTGYYDVKTRKIVMAPKKVLKHYIFPFFFIDLFSSMPYNIYIHFSENYEAKYLKFFYLLKLFRLPTFYNYLRKLFVRLDVWNYQLKTINFFSCILILIWWSTSWSFLVLSDMRSLSVEYFRRGFDVFSPMLESFYHIVKIFLLIEISHIHTGTAVTIGGNLFFLFVGSVLNMVILAQVIQTYQRHSSSRSKYDSLIQEIGEYMKYKELPNSLKNKVFRFVEFKFQKNIFKEGDILLSKILTQDVILHNCKRMVERVDFFKGLPSTLILRIVTKLRSEIYLPNDMIVQAGVPGNAMYFIYMGTVAVYTINDQEICHLEDGSHFGEISLVINEPRVASVVATTDCEVYRLSRKDFLEAVEPYPSLWGKIKNSALKRLRNTNRIMSPQPFEDDVFE